MADGEATLVVMSRKEARARGLKHYFTGEPCKRGHISPRYVSCKMCTACNNERSLVNYHNNKDAISTRRKNYYQREKDRIKKKVMDRYKENSGPKKEYAKQYRKRYLGKIRALAKVRKHRRRARLAAVHSTCRPNDVTRIRKMQNGKCAYCRKKLGNAYHIDHITPISKGGTNDAKNIQITCPSCNLRKSAKDATDFARELGLLI